MLNVPGPGRGAVRGTAQGGHALRRSADHLLRDRPAHRPHAATCRRPSRCPESNAGVPNSASEPRLTSRPSSRFLASHVRTLPPTPTIRTAACHRPSRRPSSNGHLDQRRASTLHRLLPGRVIGGGAPVRLRLRARPPGRRHAGHERWPARTCSGRSGMRTTTSARTTSARSIPSILVQGAIKGMFEALDDPFSQYLTEEEYRSSLGGLSGEFEGVGIEMATRRRRGRAVRDRLRHLPPDGHARHPRLARDRRRPAGRRRRHWPSTA